MVNILFIGDIVSKIGRQKVKKLLPSIKKEYNIDLTIANCENATNGRGISLKHYNELLASGVDVFTTGEHIFKLKETEEHIQNMLIAMPLNLYSSFKGKRYIDIDLGKKGVVRVVSLLGMTNMKLNVFNPFHTMTKFLDEEDNKDKILFVDFHAEVTSEKQAMKWFLKNKVQALVGTHTHIQTNDAQVFKNTAFITDVGMTGSTQSVIGVKPQIIIDRFNKGLTKPFEWVKEGEGELNAVVISIDTKKIMAKNIFSLKKS